MASVAFWAVGVLPARLLGLDHALLDSAGAAALCLLPGAVALLAGELLPLTARGQVWLALAGAPVRMAVVLGGAWAASAFVSAFHGRTGFWVWVLVFYLFTLAAETLLLVGGRGRAGTVARAGVEAAG